MNLSKRLISKRNKGGRKENYIDRYRTKMANVSAVDPLYRQAPKSSGFRLGATAI